MEVWRAGRRMTEGRNSGGVTSKRKEGNYEEEGSLRERRERRGKDST